jgi:cell shape-determining protein MreC
MIRIRAPTAHRDVTYNNIKASKSSVNDMFCQSITKIEGTSHVEVFSSLENLAEENRVLREQLAALNTRLGALDARVNELVAE